VAAVAAVVVGRGVRSAGKAFLDLFAITEAAAMRPQSFWAQGFTGYPLLPIIAALGGGLGLAFWSMDFLGPLSRGPAFLKIGPLTGPFRCSIKGADGPLFSF
jgi:hypothetical protein